MNLDFGFAVAAGWCLKIVRRLLVANGAARDSDILELTNDFLHAEIEASRGRGLTGGSTDIKISGLPRSMIEQLLGETGAAMEDSFLVGKLHLYWRGRVPLPGLDQAVSAVASLAGVDNKDSTLAATFAITGIAPEVDGVRYALRLTGPDEIFHALSVARTQGSIRAADADALARAVVAKLGAVPAAGSGGLAGALAAVLPGPAASALSGPGGGGGAGGAAAEPVADQPNAAKGIKGIAVLATLDERIAEAAGGSPQKDARALGAYLLRDDAIHIGKDVVKLFEAEPRELPAGHALIAAAPRKLGEAVEGEEGSYALTLRGEPQIKPGDVVKFPRPVPKSDLPGTGLAMADAVVGAVKNVASAFTGGGGPDTFLLVDRVTHTFSARTGFITEVAGVALKGEKKPELPAKDAEKRSAGGGATADSAEAIRSKMSALSSRASLEIGEVRTFVPVSQPQSPGQTSTVLYGLGERAGMSNALRQVDVDRLTDARMAGIAYATPFAWGAYGLVLPRLPGTRVVLAEHGGTADDALDVGSLWWSGDGNTKPGPPDAKAGDYWLAMPVKPTIEAGEGSEAIVPSAKGASHDLTDALGNRVMQLGQMTVRIGKIVDGDAALARPALSAESEGLVIEVEGSGGTAKVTINLNGEIAITSKGKIAITSEAELSLTAKKLTLKSDTDLIMSAKDIKSDATDSVALKVNGTSLTVSSSEVKIA
jgi:hypothetical protein